MRFTERFWNENIQWSETLPLKNHALPKGKVPGGFNHGEPSM